MGTLGLDTKKRIFRAITLAVQVLLVVVILSGVILSTFQFANNRSLWTDEISLALNIINASWSDLLLPLGYHQVAPIGFLYLEKIALLIFGGDAAGQNDLALRIIPFLSFLGCIPLIYNLAKKISCSKIIASLSTAIYAINPTAIYYASEVKQYATDTLVVLIILNLFLYFNPKSYRSVMLIAIAGATALWMSNVIIIILFTLSIVIISENIVDRNKGFRWLVPLTAWASSFLIYYYFFIHDHPSSDFMRDYWQDKFLPINPFSAGFWSFIKQNVFIEFVNLMKIESSWLIIGMSSALGLIYLAAQKHYRILSILIFPILIHLVLSSLEMYPFARRLLLFQLPLLIVLTCYAFYSLLLAFNNRLVKLAMLVFVIPLSSTLWLDLESIPYEVSYMKPLLHNLNNEISDREFVRSYCKSRAHSRYYQPYFDRLQNTSIAYIDLQNQSVDEEVNEVASSGQSGWLIFKHWEKHLKNPESEEMLIAKLRALNYVITLKHEAHNTRLYKINKKKIIQHGVET